VNAEPIAKPTSLLASPPQTNDGLYRATVGPSGKIDDQWIHSLDISYLDIFIRRQYW
jgi:hypothetical protein